MNQKKRQVEPILLNFFLRSLVWFAICFAILSIGIAIQQAIVNDTYSSAVEQWKKDCATWKITSKEIAARNNFWQMVAKEKDFVKNDDGILASDLRNVYIENPDQKTLTQASARLNNGSGSYLHADPIIGQMVFGEKFNQKNGKLKISDSFNNWITKFKRGGIKEVTETPKDDPANHKPSPSDPDLHRYNVWAYVIHSNLFWIFWTIIALIAFALSHAHLTEYGETDWDNEWFPEGLDQDWWRLSDEPLWQWSSILLLGPIFFFRAILVFLEQLILALNQSEKSVWLAYIKSKKAEQEKVLKDQKEQAEEKARQNEPVYQNLLALRNHLAQLKEIERAGAIPESEKARLTKAITNLENTISKLELKLGFAADKDLSPEVQAETNVALLDKIEVDIDIANSTIL